MTNSAIIAPRQIFRWRMALRLGLPFLKALSLSWPARSVARCASGTFRALHEARRQQADREIRRYAHLLNCHQIKE